MLERSMLERDSRRDWCEQGTNLFLFSRVAWRGVKSRQRHQSGDV